MTLVCVDPLFSSLGVRMHAHLQDLYNNLITDQEEYSNDQEQNSSRPIDITPEGIRSLNDRGKSFDRQLVAGQVPESLLRDTPGSLAERFGRREIDGAVPQQREISASKVRSHRQVLRFFQRMPFPPIKEDDVLWGEFVDGQRKLSNHRVNLNHPVLVHARAFLHRALARVDLSDIIPGHGPGAVAEGLDCEKRYAFPAWSSQANRAYPVCEFGSSLTSPFPIPVVSGAMTTRVVIVPKDYRSGRLISVEPAFQQWLQQGQMRTLYSAMAREPFRKYVRLQDQTYNHELLKDLSYATIDLSNASDNVSAVLVWNLIPAHLRQYLFRTRTPYATYKGMTQRLAAFAPMGSAVCFPVETLVFLGLCIGVAKLCYPRDWQQLDMRVYGDDIIVPVHIMDPLLGTLLELGMTPNQDKTCGGSTLFRESCGIDMFKCQNVTSWRPRILPSSKGDLRSGYEWSLLNRGAFAFGFYRTAAYCADMARKTGRWPTSTEDRDGFLRAHYPDLSGCRVRWNRNYQRREVRVCTFVKGCTLWHDEAPNRLLARLVGDPNDRVPARYAKHRLGWRAILEED